MLLRGLIFKINAKVDILRSDDLITSNGIRFILVFLSISSEEIFVFVDDFLFNALRQDYLDGVSYALHHLQVSWLLGDYLWRDWTHPIERDTHFDFEDVLEVGLCIHAIDMHQAIGLEDFVKWVVWGCFVVDEEQPTLLGQLRHELHHLVIFLFQLTTFFLLVRSPNFTLLLVTFLTEMFDSKVSESLETEAVAHDLVHLECPRDKHLRLLLLFHRGRWALLLVIVIAAFTILGQLSWQLSEVVRPVEL